MPRTDAWQSRARQGLGALWTTFLLGGCGNQPGLWNQYFQLVRESYRSSVGAGTISLEQAAAVPYASLAYRVDGSNEAILVLATDTNGDLLWTAASRVVLLTRNGRILRTVGLPRNNGGTTIPSKTRLSAPAEALKAPFRSTRFLDFPESGLVSVQIDCVARAAGREIVTVLGTAIATTRVDERCQSRKPRWSFTDKYWVDGDGFSWMTRQHVHPSGTTLQVKILRPPG